MCDHIFCMYSYLEITRNKKELKAQRTNKFLTRCIGKYKFGIMSLYTILTATISDNYLSHKSRLNSFPSKNMFVKLTTRTNLEPRKRNYSKKN